MNSSGGDAGSIFNSDITGAVASCTSLVFSSLIGT